jgi:uncharacterized protein
MTFKPDPAEKNLKVLNNWADKLACPACLGALRLETAVVVCSSCGRLYPIVDGIPVLIVERAALLPDQSPPAL